MTGFGVLLVLTGIVIFYDHIQVLEPLRRFFRAYNGQWTYYAVYAMTLVSVAISFLLTFNKSPKRLCERADAADLKGDLAGLNPSISPLERRSLRILGQINKTENLQWNAATWPGFLGIALFVLDGGEKGLLLYLAISMATNFMHRPSLEAAEDVMERYVRRRSPPIAGKRA